VSGVVLFAATPRARARLAEARERGQHLRRYVAIAGAHVEPSRGTWAWRIGRTNDPRLRAVDGRDAADALTKYAVAAATKAASLLGVEPVTGRTHQIRVHAAHAGAPLLGDGAYGGARRIVAPNGSVRAISRIALHAAWVETSDARGDPWRVDAAIPDELRTLWREAHGDEEAWANALARW
jgi:23S rRNA pseudouridine955/2504/2580 synthase/23S rRNA pseudouridine1911/1915/1917 synthase